MTEYITMWENYCNFTDRTGLRGFWLATLFDVIAAVILMGFASLYQPLSFLIWLYALAGLLPRLGIHVRRLRDAGIKWTWMLIALIPIVGWIVYIFLLLSPSFPENGVPVV